MSNVANCFGYVPERTNGVCIILKEPGGNNNEENSPQLNQKGNGNWYIDKVCSNEHIDRTVSIYRERFMDLLEALKIGSRDIENLKRCYYTNICYDRQGTTVDSNEGYGKLSGTCKAKRFDIIKNAFIEATSDFSGERVIFLIDDTFKELKEYYREQGVNLDINNGLVYTVKQDPDGKQDTDGNQDTDGDQYDEFFDASNNIRVMAIHHPIRAKSEVHYIRR